MRSPRRALPAASCAATALLLAAAGCGSETTAQLPPAAGPSGAAPLASGRLVATVDGRARTLTIRDARTRAALASAPAGVGPSGVACAAAAASLCWVTDTRGDALLVFRVGAGGHALHLTRRVYLPGAPTAITLDAAQHRLRVVTAQGHHLALLPAHGRPHVLKTYNNADAPNSAAVSQSQRAK